MAGLDSSHDWREFREVNADLVDHDYRDVMAHYYSPERLDSALARIAFLLPDRAPARS